MKENRMQVRCALQIAKPVNEVFTAIVDPAHMTNYWINDSNGRIEEGRTLTWGFPEFELKFPVYIDKVEKDKFISWRWDLQNNGFVVAISFGEFEGSTVVTITETPLTEHDPGMEWVKGNTEGWANFLACLKAYVEHGINLRIKAFDFRREEFAKMK